MRFAIETDHPAPPVANRGRPVKYPFRELPVGGSFFVPADLAKPAANAAAAFKYRNVGWDFTTKFEADGAVRIWRV